MGDGPQNRAFALGLDGWRSLGRVAPVPIPRPGGQAVRLRANTTLISPPLAVPRRAQTLMVGARAPRLGATVEVRARPVRGGRTVELGVIEPGGRFRDHPVGVASVAGRTVRIELDPVPAVGRAVEISGLGPLLAPLPGWSVSRGLARVERRGPRGVLVVDEDPLVVRTPRFRPGPGARALRVELRGAGRVTLTAGGRRVSVRARAGWKAVRLSVSARARALRLTVAAAPGEGRLELRELGRVERG